ncbi:MAG: hypothetical protein R3F31_06615 [Verrucomicrobiales bacterium]|nr:hypothetical protein [Akkermansiaceae bacterium]
MADLFPMLVRTKYPNHEDAAEDGGASDGWGVSSGLRVSWRAAERGAKDCRYWEGRIRLRSGRSSLGRRSGGQRS